MKPWKLSQTHKDHSNRKRLLHFLSRYLLLSCVISLAFIPIYMVALKSTKKNVTQEVYLRFETGLTRASGIVTNLGNLSDAISGEQETNYLSNIKGQMKPRDYMALKKASDYMVKVLVSDSIIKNAYTLFKNNDIFLSKSLIDTDRKQIYNYFYGIEGVSEEEWAELVINTQGQFEFLPFGRTNWTFAPLQNQILKDTIHIAFPAPNHVTYSVKSVTVFILDYKEFFLLFGSEELLENGFCYLTDSQGNIILENNYSGEPLSMNEDIQQLMIDDVPYTIMKVNNSEMGTNAVMGIPEAYFSAKVKSVWRFITLYSGLIIIISIMVSFILAYYQNSPFKKMMDSIKNVLSPPFNERNEYHYISNAILSLDNKSKRYEEEINFMRDSIYNNLLDRMLNGKIHTLEDEEKCVAEFKFISDYFCVCIMRIEQTVEISEGLDITRKINVIMREQLAMNTQLQSYFYNGEILKTSIILNLPEESRSDLSYFYDSFSKVVMLVRDQYDINIIFGIGTIACGIKYIGLSATNAQDALRLSDKDNPVHTWFDRKKNRNNMIVGSKTSQRLYEILLIGNPQYVEEDLNLLLRNLSKSYFLSDTEIRQSFYVLRNTLESASYDILNEDEKIELPEYSKELSALELFATFYSPCIDLCNHRIIRKSKEDSRLNNEMIDYINNNYMDSNLCAMNIADKFFVSEKYVYSIIKSHTGKGLGEFIEQLRFSKVEELLQGGVDISEISATVGFNSVNTFYKAFKRLYGISPGAWRGMNQKYNNND